MKKILIFVLSIIVISTSLVACGHKHTWGEWVNTKDATCSETGFKERMCECGEKEVKEVSATGFHSWGEWVIVSNPTTTSVGLEERKCKNCNHKETKIIEKLPDIIYYSDLFYGYDTSYLMNAYIEDYYDDVDNVARDIFNDYINSPKYIWTQIETSIAAALSAKEFFEMMSDAYGGTNFNYLQAVDSANILFAKELIGETYSMEMIGDVEKLTKPANKIIGICNDFEDLYYDSPETHEVIIEKFFDALYNSDVFKAEGKTYLSSVKTQFLAEAESAGLLLSSTKELISYLKAISVGLMLEELRIEILDDIIENSSGYKTVYDGMTRLKKQLVQGFASYVVKTYMQDKVVDAIFDAMQDAITGQIGAYGFVSAILKTASWVLFDVLFDIPNMDDMLVQMVLNEYVDGFHFILKSKADSFKFQFDSEDVGEYESLVEGFDASCKALLKASEKLTLSSNYSNLVAVKNWHKTFSYDNYIKVVKDIISVTPIEERKVKKLGTWSIKNDEVELVSPSDTIEYGKIYTFNGVFDGNIEAGGYVKISSGDSYVINGDLICPTGGYLEIEENATLIVNGNVSFRPIHYNGGIINNGTLIFNGENNYVKLYNNATTVVNGNFSGRIIQELSDAKIHFRGDASADSHSTVTGGTFIFDGEEMQNVSRVEVPIIIIENKSNEGVVFNTSINVSKLFNHNGNNFTLYNNGNGSTFVDYDGDGVLDNLDADPIDPNK